MLRRLRSFDVLSLDVRRSLLPLNHVTLCILESSVVTHARVWVNGAERDVEIAVSTDAN